MRLERFELMAFGVDGLIAEELERKNGVLCPARRDGGWKTLSYSGAAVRGWLFGIRTWIW
jgi:hypothetical protein